MWRNSCSNSKLTAYSRAHVDKWRFQGTYTSAIAADYWLINIDSVMYEMTFFSDALSQHIMQWCECSIPLWPRTYRDCYFWQTKSWWARDACRWCGGMVASRCVHKHRVTQRKVCQDCSGHSIWVNHYHDWHFKLKKKSYNRPAHNIHNEWLLFFLSCHYIFFFVTLLLCMMILCLLYLHWTIHDVWTSVNLFRTTVRKASKLSMVVINICVTYLRKFTKLSVVRWVWQDKCGELSTVQY